MNDVTTSVTVNGRRVSAQAPGHYSLLRWLREKVQAYEVKAGCGEGVCGACTVRIDGAPMASCCLLAAQADGCEIVTSVGLLDPDGSLGALQRSFWESAATQCGFCTQGMLMTAADLVAADPPPSRTEIREALHGNLCRCTGYQPIVDAVENAIACRKEAQVS